MKNKKKNKIDFTNAELAERLLLQPFKKEFKLNCWGKSDFYCYKNEILVLLEIEKGQKHPNTNVLKIWPYLEENLKQKILLIHLFRPENEASPNRVKLCDFTGSRLERLFSKRFAYLRLDWQPKLLSEQIRNIDHKIKSLQ